jgi:hypothetical protein
MNNRSIVFLSALVLGTLVISFTSRAQTLSGQPLFSSDAPLEIVLETDLVGLMNDTRAEPDYREARFICQLDKSNALIFDIRVRPRGRTRRKPAICAFPPLMLNFREKSTAGTLFEGQNKLKLVTHCRDETAFRDFAIREYMIYKTYNLLTDESFRVRLVKVTYRDVQKRMAPLSRTGFLIEDDDALASRLNARVYEGTIYSWDSCEARSMDRMALFQFMVGNTDWWVHTRHNVLIVEKTGHNLVPVPFDFDYAGLIDASYAIPSPYLPIKSVRERFFKGRCLPPGGYAETIQLFLEHKETIHRYYEESDLVDRSQRNSDWRFLEEFYDLLGHPEVLEQQLQNFCRTDPYALMAPPTGKKKP